jgi:pyruvate formate lyase activating enzyme
MVYDGPGIRTVVFFKGCPLRCLWCDNPESQLPTPQLMYFDDKCIDCGRCIEACPTGAITAGTDEKVAVDLGVCKVSGKCVVICPTEALVMSGNVMTVDEVMSEILKDEIFFRRSKGGVTLGGGEPCAQPEFAREILKRCREKDIHTAMETCGYANWDAMQSVLEYTNLVYLDFKHMNPEEHKKLTGASNDLILSNAEKIFQLANDGKLEVIVRFVCVPGYNDSKENLSEAAEFLAKSKVKRAELLRYHELGTPKYAVLDKEYKLDELRVDEDYLKVLCDLVNSHGIECKVL